MGNIMKMKNLHLFLMLVVDVLTQTRGLDKREANNFLSRHRRKSNRRGFEEVWEGNLERECIEETCNQEELVESLDTYEKMVGERFKEIFDDCEKMSGIIKVEE